MKGSVVRRQGRKKGKQRKIPRVLFLSDVLTVNFSFPFLSQDRDRRFTYCPEYNSATVLPVHPETVKKQEFLDSWKKWRTPKGFICPGKKTSLESNKHSKKPDSARMDELRKV